MVRYVRMSASGCTLLHGALSCQATSFLEPIFQIHQASHVVRRRFRWRKWVRFVHLIVSSIYRINLCNITLKYLPSFNNVMFNSKCISFFFISLLFRLIEHCSDIESPPSQSFSDQGVPPSSKVIDDDVSLKNQISVIGIFVWA